MSRTVIIIPCGFKKRRCACRAKQLYQGPYFLSNLRWALSVCHEHSIFIFSAKHGLLCLDDQVEPYNLKMGDPGSIKPDVIREQAKSKNLFQERLYAVGGKNYLNALSQAGLKFSAPVAGLSMGRSMSSLKRNHGKLPPWTEWVP